MTGQSNAGTGGLEKPRDRKDKRAAEAVVQCKGFRCAAYRDKLGAWRSVADDSQLEVIEVVVAF
jgi:hypothetical protein